jgi:hypothetical protein
MMESALCKAVFYQRTGGWCEPETVALRCSSGAEGKKTERRLEPFRESCVSALGNFIRFPVERRFAIANAI